MKKFFLLLFSVFGLGCQTPAQTIGPLLVTNATQKLTRAGTNFFAINFDYLNESVDLTNKVFRDAITIRDAAGNADLFLDSIANSSIVNFQKNGSTKWRWMMSSSTTNLEARNDRLGTTPFKIDTDDDAAFFSGSLTTAGDFTASGNSYLRDTTIYGVNPIFVPEVDWTPDKPIAISSENLFYAPSTYPNLDLTGPTTNHGTFRIDQGQLDVLSSGTRNIVADPFGFAGNFVSPTPINLQGGTVSLVSNDDVAINKGGVLAFGGRYDGTTGYANFASIKGLKSDATSGNYGGYLSLHTRLTGTDTAERMRITDTGNVGIGTTEPTRTLSMKAGASAAIAQVGGVIADHYVDSSIGGAETDVYTDTLPVSILAANGDKVIASYGGNFVTIGTEVVQLKVYFAGTAIWDSTGIAVTTGTTSWRVNVETIRVSSSVVRYTVSLNTSGASGFVYCTSGELTGLTLSSTAILKITGQSSGVGSGSGDIIGKMGYLEWKSAL